MTSQLEQWYTTDAKKVFLIYIEIGKKKHYAFKKIEPVLCVCQCYEYCYITMHIPVKKTNYVLVIPNWFILFLMYRSKFVDFIDMTCINHPDGITRAVWDPYFHHVYAGFPPCITFSKLYFFHYFFTLLKLHY